MAYSGYERVRLSEKTITSGRIKAEPITANLSFAPNIAVDYGITQESLAAFVEALYTKVPVEVPAEVERKAELESIVAKSKPKTPKVKTLSSVENYMQGAHNPEEIYQNLDALRNGRLPMEPHVLTPDYFDRSPLRGQKRTTLDTYKTYPAVEFDTLVGTGFSGTLPLMYVAKKLGVNWVAVRKDRANSHASHDVEGVLGARWLFLDDFMSGGATFQRTHKRIKDFVNGRNNPLWGSPAHFETEFVGGFFYANRNIMGNMFWDADNERFRGLLGRL